ncbi:hypothetical protein, partial [Rhizobium leguminosarum]|uniref:hypothetical protein n=1 Tax=Rhizobium leguminosarum TaxID=384 RepID=UPI00197CF814
SRMRAFVLKAGKERVMIKELANEHKRAKAFYPCRDTIRQRPCETKEPAAEKAEKCRAGAKQRQRDERR